MISEPDLKLSDINSIPKKINDYINYRKRIKNNENLFIRSDYIFSREDFITDDYFLCEIILLLTALSKNAEIYMMKICDLNTEIQEFWSDCISKYIEVRSIRGDDESICQQTQTGILTHLSKDKISNVKNKKIFDASYSMNKSDNTNLVIDFEEQKNIVINLKKKNDELEKEKYNFMIIIDKNEKEIKEQQRIITNLNQQIQEIKNSKDNKIFNLEKKIKEYEDEIEKLNQIIKENQNNLNKEKKYEEENINLKEKIIKLVNENLVLKTYKEYKSKYESLLLVQKNQENQNQNIFENAKFENITETKEKYLAALKNNVSIQKENERLRKEITSLKDELKKEKKQNSDFCSNNTINNENGKEINYKTEFEKINIKAERYKYLLDNKDKQIEKLEKELEKYKNGNINENGGITINDLENKKESTKLVENYRYKNNDNIMNSSNKKLNINNSNTKKIKKSLNLNNLEPKLNLSNKNFSTKNTNKYLSMNKNLAKEGKIIKTNMTSERKKDKSIKNKKIFEHNKNSISHNLITSTIMPKNNLNIKTNTDFSNNDIALNPILNLNSSVKINNNNFSNFLENFKENNNINNNELCNKNKKKLDISTKSVRNVSNININSILDNIHSKIKNDKKNQNEFILFIKKIDKELNLNIANQINENNNILKINEDIYNEKIKELKKDLNQYKRKDSDMKLKLTFLQNEKIKLEEEKQKLQEELKKLSQNTPLKETRKNSLIKKYYSSTKKVNGFTNLNINEEIDKISSNIIDNSPRNEKEKSEETNGYEKIKENKSFNEKGIKYSFKKKKLIKSTTIEMEDINNSRKILSDEKNSIFKLDDEPNEIDNENNNEKENDLEKDKIVGELNNKINDLINERNNLKEEIKNLNENLEYTKLKGNNQEAINSNLIKENVELKKALLLIKENYDNEFKLVSSSLINLTEKYQKLKQELLKERKNEQK